VELGTKSNWTLLGVPGHSDLDVYYGWYDDVQKNDTIPVIDSLTPQFVAITFNAARASIKGLEFQSTFVPDENFEINTYFSYTDASYSKFLLPAYISTFLPPAPELDHAGNPFSYTPKEKLGIQPRFHIPVATTLGMPFVSAAVYWQSSEWFTD